MPSTLSLPAAGPHRNHQLFSDYYLNTLLPQRPEWRALAEAAKPVMHTLQAALAGYTPSDNEAQTEEGWIKPVLKALGHEFEVQPALKTPDGTKRPDYVFYRDAASLLARKNKTLTDALPQQGGLAVGDAKAWDRPLDMAARTKSSDPFSNKNPSYQIAFYIQHSGLAWGILTNGRLWRLYHKDTAHKLDHYYEVDLPALLETGHVEEFLYFYGLFHRSAFDTHTLGLSALLTASEEYARGVGETLKRQVYDALRHLSQGFLDYAPNGLAADAVTLKAIYDHSLILLYRLLFILYAESRELLPVRESSAYREAYSLACIKQESAHSKHLLPTSATLWPRLKTLFGFIDKGEPPLKVATFNGGLFDSSRHEFLERYTVGDARLQQAINRLAQVAGQFVDYRDLSVRHLGTIYEGLLEYHLEALSPPAPNNGGAGSPPAPNNGGDGEVGGGWTVALLNDKGERKATGSYYTPDYIVKYIVEQAVGPMLRAAILGQDSDKAKVGAVLEVNVLDPAMGSGHFLVEATEFIARFLVEEAITPGADAGDEEEADLLYWKRRVVTACIYGVDLNPLAVELAKLSLWLTTAAKDRPLSFLDHHLRTGNALVGARLSDLQLGGKPKSKKSASQAARQEAAGQTTMMTDDAFRQSMSLAVGNMWLIEETEAQTVADVKKQEELYAALRAEFTRKWGRLADLVTASHFSVAIDHFLWKPLVAYAKGEAVTALPKFAEWLEAADALARERRFFHWELEFPEVFFDRFGRPLDDAAGFDAIIGNPPYIRQEELSAFKPYFAATYPEVYHGVADIFVYFFAQALRQLQRGGRLSYISSNSWLRSNYASPLRAHLRTQATMEKLVDLGNTRVFADAPDLSPAIHVVKRESPATEHIAQVAVFRRGEDLSDFSVQVHTKAFPVSIHDQTDTGWQLGDDIGRKIFTKLMACGQPLGNIVNGQMYRGVLTGLNEAFYLDTPTRDRLVKEDPICAEIIRPLLRGEDLRPWYQESEGRWLIVLPNGWTRAKFGLKMDEQDVWNDFQCCYPSVAAHLLPFADAARKRQDKGQYWWELRPCDYYAAFDHPKIFWPEMARFPRFSWDEAKAYVNNKGYIAPVNEPWLLSLLNSRAMWFVIMRSCLNLGERAGMGVFQLFAQYISRLPIPDLSPADREALGTLAQEITTHARARYALHTQTRHRLQTDLGNPSTPLNQKLTAWWTLDFPGLRAELKKVYKADIPVAERGDWEAYLTAQKAQHTALTAQIVAGEEELNARVYALFGLTPAEIRVVEESTKYRYGEV